MSWKVLSLPLIAVSAMAAEHTLQFSQPVGNITRVVLAVATGDVRITGSDGAQITAKVVVSGKRWQVEEMAIAAKVTDNTLKLVLEPTKHLRKKAWEDWELVLPKGIDFSLKAGIGDVVAKNLAGRLELQVGVGDILVERLGADLDAKTGVGDVELFGLYPVVGEIRLATGVGSIDVDTPQDHLGHPRGIVSETFTGQGPGKAKIAVTTGVGGIKLRLREK